MSGAGADFMGADAPLRRQTKFISSAACLSSVSAAKPRLLSEKYISLSETDKVGQEKKPKTNAPREWLHSDYMITSLANKKLCVGRLAGVYAPCGQCRRSVSTRPARPSLYSGLRNNLLRLPCPRCQSNRARINMCRMSYKSKEIVGRNSKSLRQKGRK